MRSMNSSQPIGEMMNPPRDLMTGCCELSQILFHKNIAGGRRTKGSFHYDNMDKWGSQNIRNTSYEPARGERERTAGQASKPF
jgi:hypothetical protein